MDRFDTCSVRCCGCEVRTGSSRNSTARTNQEFERYASVEIEVAVFMMGPNEESMDHAQVRCSIHCGFARESPTMVESDACVERRVRCVFIPSIRFECC